MEFDSEMWSALLGAIVGAVVGGGISWLLQLDARKSNQKQLEADRLEQKRSLAYGIIYKLMAIASHYAVYKHHLDESYSAAAEDPEVDEPWQFVLPMGDVPSPLQFTSAEMTLLVSLQMDEVFNSLLTLADAHNQMGRLTELYRVKREALTELLPVSAFVGNELRSDVDRQQGNRARPLMIELNHVAEAMRAFCERDAPESVEILDKAHAAFRDKLNLPIKLQLAEAPAAARAAAHS